MEPGQLASGATREYAELIAFWIGEYDPRHLSLSDVDARRSECHKAIDLPVAVNGTKVKMESILAGLLLRHSDEQQTGKSIGRRADLNDVRRLVYDHPTQSA